MVLLNFIAAWYIIAFFNSISFCFALNFRVYLFLISTSFSLADQTWACRIIHDTHTTSVSTAAIVNEIILLLDEPLGCGKLTLEHSYIHIVDQYRSHDSLIVLVIFCPCHNNNPLLSFIQQLGIIFSDFWAHLWNLAFREKPTIYIMSNKNVVVPTIYTMCIFLILTVPISRN